MIITAIERQPRRRGRVEVWTDGQCRFDVSRKLVRERGLRIGHEIDGAEIDEIVALDARREALRLAASLIARRPRSEREVGQRLSMRRFDPALVRETLDKLKAAGLIDDREFAQSWVEARDHRSPRGRRMVAAELRARGVDAPTAVVATAQIEEEDAAYRAASRPLRTLRDAEYARFRDRLVSHLQRRGFAWGVIRSTIDRCWRERDDAALDADAASAEHAFDDLEYAIE